MLLTEHRPASTAHSSPFVTDSLQSFSASNRQTYLRLRLALGIRLRRQVFISVCDDLPLRNQLTQWLVNDLSRSSLPELEVPAIEATGEVPDRPPSPGLRLVKLTLRPEQPDLQKQIAEWLSHRRGRIDRSQIAFQIVGIDALTSQSAATQRQFLNSLRALGHHYAQWDLNLVLWVTKPWLHAIRQSAPEFWRWYTGIFDFSGQPQVAKYPTETLHTSTPQHPSTPTPNTPFITQWLSIPSDAALTETVHNLALLHQQSADDATLADAYRDLGNRYRDQPQQSLETLDLGIQAYGQALIRLPNTNPIVTDLLNDLGNLYWMRSRQQDEMEARQNDLDSAIEHYQKALAHTDEQQEAARYIMLQNNLGATWGELAQYFNSTTYLPHSISAYEQALATPDPYQDNQRRANTQNNLGTAYWTLAQYENPDAPLLQKAISHYESALEFYDAAQYPMPHAMIQNNLGTAYWNFSQCEKLSQFSTATAQDLLVQAITAYQIALIYRTPEALPLGYAATQNNLGTAYWNLATDCQTLPTEMAEILDLTIVSYQASLAMVESLIASGTINFSFDPFATHHNLAAAFHRSVSHSHSPLNSDEQHNALQKAFTHHQIAWQGWQGQADYVEAAINGLAQVLRLAHDRLGSSLQSQLLASLPPQLLSEIMPKI
jgi:tetratricopeptide (TPR) repeat protein